MRKSRRGKLIGICHGPGRVTEAICTGLRSDLARLLPDAVVTIVSRVGSISSAHVGSAASDATRATLDTYDVLLIAIDPGWVPPEFREGNDPVRIAIESAVARHVPLVPLLVDGAALPSSVQQTPSVREMMNYNAHTLRSGSEYYTSLTSLVESLRPKTPQLRRTLWIGISLLALVLLAVLAASILPETLERDDAAASSATLFTPSAELPAPTPASAIVAGGGSTSAGPANSSSPSDRAELKASDKAGAKAQADASCAQSCKSEGLCAKRDGACVALSNAGCQGSWLCRYWGRCTVEGTDCRAKSDADCRASQSCAELGACALSRGECKVASDSHCKSAKICRAEGRCTAYFGECVAP